MKKILKKLKENKNICSYIIIFFIALFICIPLFSNNMDIARDDGIQHICRLIGTMSSLKEGQIFPVIMSKFCNGFGYSWNLFYSPLTAYLPLIFSCITSSFVVMLKIFMFFTMFLSGIFMFKFTYKISQSYKASVISAILYMSAPYHLTDLYNRIAIAEITSFIFLPIVFSGMYDLIYKRNSKPYGIVIGATGIILAHNVIAEYLAIFCLIYLLINYKVLKDIKKVKKIIICVILILLCTSFYILPLLEHMFTTTYEVVIPNRMYKDNTLVESKLTFMELFFIQKNDMNFHIGLLIIIGIILAIHYMKNIRNPQRKNLIIFLILGIFSTLMASRIFPYEYMPKILKMIQFSWRMMEFSSFFLSIVAGIGIAMLFNKYQSKEILGIAIILIYLTISVISQNNEVEIPFNEEKYLKAVPVTASTGRVHAGCATFEYLPQKAFSNRKYIENRTEDIYILQGRVNIIKEQKENTNLTFEIENCEENTKLELPYIYYLGYSAKLEKDDNTVEDLKIEESDKGFCMITIPSISNAKITVSYTGTMLMKISYGLTLIGVLLLIFLYKN